METSAQTYRFTVTEDREFGSIRLGADAKEFDACGFRPGDSLDIAFENGHRFEDVPFYSGYYARTGEPVVVRYMGSDEILLAYCFNDCMWKRTGCGEGSTVTVRRNTAGKYLICQQTMDLWYSEDPADFPTAEAFSNFRPVTGGKIAQGAFFRGASPVNDSNKRAAVTDGLLAKYGIRRLLDLADTEARIASYRTRPGYASPNATALIETGNASFLGLTAAYRQETYRASLVRGLKETMRHAGPVYIQCTEGKDRTGFVCMLLEALCGATVAELEWDYMETYAMYYGITRESTPEKYDVVRSVRFLDMLLWLAEVPEEAGLGTADLAFRAGEYLRSGGMTERELTALKEYLTTGVPQNGI
ncbi:MAG: tyrosine-protein phosphatase [Clostridia bacterium]|nr:tyrosine-protein phosphatase [Clostridia bacterium]